MIYFLTTCEHCSSSQHCSDDIFFRTQVLYLTHSVLPDKALHFWLLGFNLSFLLQLKYWLLVVSYSLLRVSFRFHSLIYLLLSIHPAFSVHLNHYKIDEDLVGIGIVIRNLRYLRKQVAQKNYQNPTGWIIKSCKSEVNLFPDLINWQATNSILFIYV